MFPNFPARFSSVLFFSKILLAFYRCLQIFTPRVMLVVVNRRNERDEI